MESDKKLEITITKLIEDLLSLFKQSKQQFITSEEIIKQIPEDTINILSICEILYDNNFLKRDCNGENITYSLIDSNVTVDSMPKLIEIINQIIESNVQTKTHRNGIFDDNDDSDDEENQNEFLKKMKFIRNINSDNFKTINSNIEDYKKELMEKNSEEIKAIGEFVEYWEEKIKDIDNTLEKFSLPGKILEEYNKNIKKISDIENTIEKINGHVDRIGPIINETVPTIIKRRDKLAVEKQYFQKINNSIEFVNEKYKKINKFKNIIFDKVKIYKKIKYNLSISIF